EARLETQDSPENWRELGSQVSGHINGRSEQAAQGAATTQSQIMPSILANSYPASALVPSLMPAPRVDHEVRSAATKPETGVASEASRLVSDRVNAFLATDQPARTNRVRPDGPPPPPPRAGHGNTGDAAGPAGAPEDSDSALMLLTADETGSDTAEGADDGTLSQPVTILLDDASIYQPSSRY
ncbi:hypothetical protein PZ897_16855, partial [Hoeflea sp. YIM 152468]|uniref:hypothetical protein n=1 Tax=Hoeflea sp. YIM 152468 TaxID=3031759 RepID=UPI0023DB8A2B